MSNTLANLGANSTVVTPSDITDMASQTTLLSVDAKVTTLVQALNPIASVNYAIMSYTEGTGVSLKWSDPTDPVNGSPWAYTVVVRKSGSAPTSPTDGTVVIQNAVRDAYKNSAYIDASGTSTDYYRAFAYATDGVYNASTNGIFKTYTLFGFYIDEEDPDESTCVHYTDANAGFARGAMDFDNDKWNWGGWQNAFFMPRPCALLADGTVDYYLNPDNYTQKADGTASDVTSSAYGGNFMMEFPQIFLKHWRSGSKIYLQVASAQLDEDFECWGCKKSDGTYADNFYLPIYEGVVASSVLRSYSSGGKPTGNTNQTQELAYAQANGEGWYTTLWCDEQLMRVLGVLVFGRLDVNEALGQCYVSGASALQINCGSMNTKGMFWGAHFDGSNNVTTGVKFFGMENWWSHRNRRCVGLNLINGVWYTKMTASTIDGTNRNSFITSDSTSDYQAAYIESGNTLPYANTDGTFITTVHAGNNAAMAPKTASGSSSTYFCDKTWNNSGTRCVLVGGPCTHGVSAGLFFSYANSAPSSYWWNFGASLSYHHL